MCNEDSLHINSEVRAGKVRINFRGITVYIFKKKSHTAYQRPIEAPVWGLE